MWVMISLPFISPTLKDELHCVAFHDIVLPNVTPCYTASLTDDFRRLRRSSCAAWFSSLRCSISLPVVDSILSSCMHLSRSSSSSCSSLVMLCKWGCGCVRVWECEDVRKKGSRTNLKFTQRVQSWDDITVCALMQLLTSVWTNQRAEFKNSAIWLVDTVFLWNRKLPELGKATAEVKQKSVNFKNHFHLTF